LNTPNEMPRHLIALSMPPEQALDLMAQVAADWGGEWRSEEGAHSLWLPVTAGLRRGFVVARVVVVEQEPGARLEVVPTENHLHINQGAAGVLAFGALGGLVAMLWPFFPGLLRLAPIAVVLAIVAWLMVAGRLRNSGLEEYLALVETAAAESDSDSTPGPA